MPNIVREKISIQALKIGMYVCELDRPWLETPYQLQGFSIDSEDDIQELENYCNFVYIDVRRSIERELRQLDKNIQPKFSTKDKSTVYHTVYSDSHAMEDEMPTAKKNFEQMTKNNESLITQLINGESLDINKFKESTHQMVDSVIRNPDAVLWLMRLKQSDDYMYQHSLRCSILATAFGRQLGLSKNELYHLAIGAALLDIGKLHLSKSLLDQPGKLAEEDFKKARDHVRLGLRMISKSGGVDEAVYAMVASHHERFNGKGYPNGLSGNDIPLFGRIAAIVDCYDAISSNRVYAKAISPSEAVKKLYEWRDIDFHAPLVEVFIQALGIYPAGSLVELSSGEVGVVMSGYRARRLRPKIMLILDKDKKHYAEFTTIDLYQITKTKEGENLNIKQSIESGSYGVNLNELLLA